MGYPGLYPEQEKDISGKTGQMQIKPSLVNDICSNIYFSVLTNIPMVLLSDTKRWHSTRLPMKGHSGKGKTIGTEIISMVARGRARERGQTTRRDMGAFQGDERVFILIVAVVTTMHGILHFKWLNLTMHKYMTFEQVASNLIAT